MDVTQIVVFLDSEYKDCYASVANCLGETSQLEEPHPILGLEKGDFLLTIDNQDIRLESKGAIQKLIEDLFTQDKELLKFSYIKDHLIRSTQYWLDLVGQIRFCFSVRG